MNKKVIIIIAVVAIVLYFILSKGKNTDKTELVVESNTNNLSGLLGSNKAAVMDDSISPEEMEYNELVNEYKQKYRRSPDASWTISQLKARIAEYDDIRAAIDLYYKLTPDDEEKEESELDKMSLQEINSLIKKEQQEQQEAYLKELCGRFIATCNNHGGIWNPAAAGGHGWDVGTLNEIIALSVEDTKKLNSYFYTRREECKYPQNYSATKAYWTVRQSLSEAIPTGTLRKYRTGASKAAEFREIMAKRGC